jgi:hypothetical protein
VSLSRLWPRLALTTASLAVSLTMVEFAGRAIGLWHPTRAFRYNAIRDYELTPNVEDVNALGFRGPEIDPHHDAGTRRIIVLGDSFTYGDGVTAAEATPARLERLLKEGGGHVEVFNLGVPGYNTAQEFAYLEQVGLALKPDLVLVGFTLSDADPGPFALNSAGHATVIRIKEFLKAHIGLYDFVRRQIRGLEESWFRNDPAMAVWPEMYPLTRATLGEPNPGWDRCRLALQGMATQCRRAGVPLLLVVWPVLEGLRDYAHLAEHEFVRTNAQALGIPVLDLYPVFAGGDPKDFCVSARNPHPNPLAHERAARAIMEHLRSPLGRHLLESAAVTAASASGH